MEISQADVPNQTESALSGEPSLSNVILSSGANETHLEHPPTEIAAVKMDPSEADAAFRESFKEHTSWRDEKAGGQDQVGYLMGTVLRRSGRRRDVEKTLNDRKHTSLDKSKKTCNLKKAMNAVIQSARQWQNIQLSSLSESEKPDIPGVLEPFSVDVTTL